MKYDKKVIPLYQAQNMFEEYPFDKTMVDKYKIKNELMHCDCCGSFIFYNQKVWSATKMEWIDVSMVCAECGSYDGGFIVTELPEMDNEQPKRVINNTLKKEVRGKVTRKVV